MILHKVCFILLSHYLPSIRSIKCCEKIEITLGYEAALLYNKTSGIYLANYKYKHQQNDYKTIYQQEFGQIGIYYNNKKEALKYQERWLVTIPGRGSPHLRTSKPDPSVNCPDKAIGWQFHKPTVGWVFNNDIKLHRVC